MLSAAALLLIVLGVILLLPPWAAVGLAAVVALGASREYAGLARAAGLRLPELPVAAATVLTVLALAWRPDALPTVMMGATMAIALVLLRDGEGRDVVARAGAAGFAVLYLGVPIGTMAAVAEQVGKEALLLMLSVVIVSDTAQYYGGRWFGRHALAPTISPKKTVEGAVCGVVASGVALAVAGGAVWPSGGPVRHTALGVAVALAGIAGDLFESRLKRASGVKDSSGLIPGHGGILDRIDALLFAAPIYHAVLVVTGASS